MKYLPDTNTWVQYLRGDAKAVSRFQSIASFDIGISSIVLEELVVGAIRFGDPKALKAVTELAELHPAVPFDHSCAEESAKLQAALIAEGLRIGSRDAQIAGTALHHKLTLVTNDSAFVRIPRLKLEDWR